MPVVEKKSDRILVIGGNGFIGRHIVAHALKLGWEVSSLNLTRNKITERDMANVIQLVADITDKTALESALSGLSFEFVVNCGGYIDHTLFFNGGCSVLDAHYHGVLNLIESVNRNSLKSFINIGSSDEYGSILAPQKETDREAPISPYSFGKVAATHFLQMLYRTFPATTLRFFLVYGPGQDKKRFLPQIVAGCLDGRAFPVSRGEQLRDFCFISDVVDAVFTVFNTPASKGEVFNIASGKPVSIRNVIDEVRCMIGSGEPQFGKIAYRPDENMELYASIEKAKTVIGWSPVIQLHDGLIKTIESIKVNHER